MVNSMQLFSSFIYPFHQRLIVLYCKTMYDLEFSELDALLAGWDVTHAYDRRVVACAIWHALYRDCVGDLADMVAVPEEVRACLARHVALALPAVVLSQCSPDGATCKDVLRLDDGAQVEVVRLRYRHRYSACISTQVGCACGCVFCATGQMGFVRNLTSGEIIAQVLHVQRKLRKAGASLSNFVLMGMGEPLLNIDNTLAAVRRLCDPHGMGFVERRITLSTAGIVPGIDRLAELPLRIRLAVSLHAATDVVRETLMPINRQYPLDALFAALRRYTQKTRRRVMLEWVMIAGINDTPAQAQALVARLTDVPAHVNLIRLNPTADFDAHSSSSEAIKTFVAYLDRADIPHTLRQHRGVDIAAGCGQLRQRAQNRGKASERLDEIL